MSNSKRCAGVDLLKYLCCFLVIFIHADVPALMDVLILPIARIAVPVFFMISGYFYRGVCERGREGRQIIKACGFVVVGSLIHLGWRIFRLILDGRSVAAFFEESFGGKPLIKLILFNYTPYRDPLWYLFAFLYVLIIVYFLRRFLKDKWDKAYVLIPILIAGNLVFGVYSVALFGKAYPIYITRNFLFCGLPYFLLGDFIASGKRNIPTKNGLIPFVFLVLAIGEVFLLKHFGVFTEADHYLITFFLAVTVFLFFLNKNENIDGSVILSTVAGLGKYSFVIYIIHPIILEIWSKGYSVITSRLGVLSDPVSWVCSVVVLIVSTAVALLWDVVKRAFKRKD